jgi:hypothetical protein
MEGKSQQPLRAFKKEMVKEKHPVRERTAGHLDEGHLDFGQGRGGRLSGTITNPLFLCEMNMFVSLTHFFLKQNLK